MSTYALEPLTLTDFSGGLNLRDAPGQLEANESPDCLNVNFDERGAVEKRLGYVKDGAMSAFGSDILNLYWSDTLDELVVQHGTDVKRRTGAGAYSAAIKTFTTAKRAAFADFLGKLLMLHPDDGLFAYDAGAGLTGPHGPSHLKGTALAVWGNKVWVAGYPTSDANGNPTRIFRSNPGSYTTWGVNDWSDAREHDDDKVLALCVAPRGGLVWFKRRGAGKVVNAETGFLQALDTARGCASAIACVPYEGSIAVINEHGVFVTDGISELVEASGKIGPLFDKDQLDLSDLDAFCAGAHLDRLVFSVRRLGQTANDLTLEWHPAVGWFAAHNFGAAAFAQHLKDDNQLYHAAPGSARLVYKTFTGGSDDGAPISSHYSTGWLTPHDGFKCRGRRVHIRGRGVIDFYVRRDFELGAGTLYQLDMAHEQMEIAKLGAGDVWDGGKLWGPGSYEGHGDAWAPGVGRHWQFRIEETSDHVTAHPALLGIGSSEEAGAWSCYGFNFESFRLGGA